MKTISLNWMKIPKESREKLLNNIYCVDCSGVTKLVSYHVEEDYFGLIIQGKCHNCGQEISTVIEK